MSDSTDHDNDSNIYTLTGSDVLRPQFWDTEQVARHCKCSVAVIRNSTNAGRLSPIARYSGKPLFSPEDAEAFRKQRLRGWA